jgi:hypothetical protein
LKTIRLNSTFFTVLLSSDIPFPVSFLLFRMYVKFKVGCCLFMKTGADTGVVCIKDGRLTYSRDVDKFAINVGTRFSAATFIRKSSNLELMPRTFSTDYLSGAGVSFFDPHSEDLHNVQQRIFNKDMYAVAVPYTFIPKTYYTDVTGKMNPATYAEDEGLEQSYSTATPYKQLWNFSHVGCEDLFNVVNRQDLSSGGPTLGVQGVQYVWEPSPNTGGGGLTRHIKGKNALGPNYVAEDFAVLRGCGEFIGRGIEGSAIRNRYGDKM